MLLLLKISVTSNMHTLCFVLRKYIETVQKELHSKTSSVTFVERTTGKMYPSTTETLLPRHTMSGSSNVLICPSLRKLVRAVLKEVQPNILLCTKMSTDFSISQSKSLHISMWDDIHWLKLSGLLSNYSASTCSELLRGLQHARLIYTENFVLFFPILEMIPSGIEYLLSNFSLCCSKVTFQQHLTSNPIRLI